VPDERPRQIFMSKKRRRRSTDQALYLILLLALLTVLAIGAFVLLAG
jgi:predicted nucleic acid-binding Zn ribbon protein